MFGEVVQSNRVEIVAVLTSVYSDNSEFKCLTWRASPRLSASEFVSAVTGPELWEGAQVRTLFYRTDAGQSWEDFQTRDSSTGKSQN